MADDNAAVEWQTSPSRRGTLTIIENSLLTIFACTWSIQHLNVPKRCDTLRQTLPRKCKWVVFTILFPEILMAHAILEFVMAVDVMKSLDETGRLDGHPPWWFRSSRRLPKTHDDEESARGSQPGATGGGFRRQETKWTLTHCYFANMGGFELLEEASFSSSIKTHLLTARHFADSWEAIEIPKISEDDLNDKSKTDYFTKVIAVIQIAQLVLSLVVRAARHLAFSQLETLTLAFAICGVLTYICYWYKPQDVRKPIRVQLRLPGKELPPNFQQRTFDSLWELLTNSRIKEDDHPLDRIQNDNIPKVAPQTTHYALYLLTIFTAGFGSLHAIAWNFEFPTSAERTLWRTATLVSTIVPPLALLAIPLSQILRPWGDSRDFMRTCLSVMREYSWHVTDKESVQVAMKKLEDVYDKIDNDKSHYQEIFGENLGKQLLGFIEKAGTSRDGNPPVVPDDFHKKFKRLVEILEMKAGPKRLSDEARTNIYPQRVLFTEPVNLAIVYATSILYCLARLSIIGVAFSSLRRMPDSVYTTTWTSNIPSVQ
ncbi:uncharacterized protein N7484_008378 [Penicillium longicatenatum]|uniref:uncharacterized protein n=1 Tax=Penicillium longicatenatum TaxID=1561947 RepID=UPI0025485332|nr:uncharacterized protein N7484_008378 [Penicillium longicatenatum]KAJ5635065.1 hypothetical protein N7484_008378 [Penicillium longicatenatum]